MNAHVPPVLGQLKKFNYIKKFEKWRDYDLLTCLLTIVGLVLSIVDYEYCNDEAIKMS